MTSNKIYNESCIATMLSLPDNAIPLTVTSPPYDNLRKYEGESDFDFENTAKQLLRITKPGGVVVWVIGDQTKDYTESGSSFEQALYFKKIGFNLHDTMIFHKKNPIRQMFNMRYNQDFEYMFVFSKGKAKTCNPIMEPCINAGRVYKGTFRHVRPEGRERVEKIVQAGREKIKGNIWSYAVGSKQSSGKHPAVFPDKLARDHIISWSNEGDLVYDPFLGSGTTAVMAIKTKRKYLGSEINKTYFDIAQRRIEEALKKRKQLELF